MRRLCFFLLIIIVLACFCSCELSYQAPAVGKLRILVYGNNYRYGTYDPVHDKYSSVVLNGDLTDSGKVANNLYKTVNDAQQVGRALSALAEKARLEYQTVYLTAPSEVTDARLVSELQALAASASEKDITIVYYSGHGFGVEGKLPYGYDTSTCSYLVPRCSERPDSCVLFPVSTFLDLVNDIKGVKVVIGDCCYSGSLVQSNNFSVTSGEYTLLDPATLFFRYRDDVCGSSSLFCLSASRYFELSYENAPNHGNFTNAFLEALGWDEENQYLTDSPVEKDGRITLSAIAGYTIAHDGKSEQTPMLSGGSNDIVLFSF